MTENWLPVPDYQGLYEVSDLGRVRSQRRKGSRGGPLRHWLSEGYPMVELRTQGERRAIRVHQLVMLAFVGQPPEGHEVRHRDGDRLNPRLSNLIYGTRSENVRDAIAHGTHWTPWRSADARLPRP